MGRPDLAAEDRPRPPITAKDVEVFFRIFLKTFFFYRMARQLRLTRGSPFCPGSGCPGPALATNKGGEVFLRFFLKTFFSIGL